MHELTAYEQSYSILEDRFTLLNMLRLTFGSVVIYGFLVSNMDIYDGASLVLFSFLFFLIHKLIKCHCNFRNHKIICKSKSEFSNVPYWLVARANRELSGKDYKKFLESDLSPSGVEILEKIKKTKKITVYDAVNLLMFEKQYGKPNQFKMADDLLKKEIKSRF